VSEEQAVQETTEAPQNSESVRAPAEDTLAYAASRLLQEPEQSAPPEKEPEETEEQVAEIEEVTEGGDEDESDDSDLPIAAESEEDETEEVEEDEEVEKLDYYLIKVDGEEVEVTLDELRSGYQRQKDYTKKTQAVSEQRKEVEAKTLEIQQLQENFMNQASLANELLNRDLKQFEKVDWAALKEQDPVAFVSKQLEVQEVRQRQAELQQQAQQIHEHNQQVQQQQAQAYLEEQRKVTLELFPEWKDKTKAEAHQMTLIEYARNQGFPDQKLANIVDASDLLVLDKARLYDEIQSKKASISKKQKAPAVRKRVRSKGVAPKGVSRQKSVDAARGKLRKSGSLKDAAALMAELQQSKVITKPRG